MQTLPHRYAIKATADFDGELDLSADGLPALRSAAPAEFDGPGDQWSPETLLVGAVGDCFILTFRSVARASRLPWQSMTCDVTGTLDRIERAMQFTAFEIRAQLHVPAGVDPDVARRLLEKAEAACLVSRSLKATTHLTAEVAVTTAPN